jgi:hypothetical protein
MLSQNTLATLLYSSTRSLSVAATNKKKLSHPYDRPWKPIGLWMSRSPHFINTQLTYCGKLSAVYASQLPFTPRKTPGTHFRYRLSQPQSHSMAGRIRLPDVAAPNDIAKLLQRIVTYCTRVWYHVKDRVKPHVIMNTIYI